MSGQYLIDILQSIAIILLAIGNIRARNRVMTRAPMIRSCVRSLHVRKLALPIRVHIVKFTCMKTEA